MAAVLTSNRRHAMIWSRCPAPALRIWFRNRQQAVGWERWTPPQSPRSLGAARLARQAPEADVSFRKSTFSLTERALEKSRGRLTGSLGPVAGNYWPAARVCITPDQPVRQSPREDSVMTVTVGLTVAGETAPIEKLAVNTIRTLCMDAVQAANSGHPGSPMDMAPTAYVLWQRFLRFDPDDPIWPNRDRFVLSSGHASMLLYSLLHLTGVKAVNCKYEREGGLSVPLEEIKRFRQIGSKCPGHTEYRWTSGVETSTGPLGQGLANSVGMAVASRWLAARYNTPGFTMFDFNVYALCGDGCIMEGISSEAA